MTTAPDNPGITVTGNHPYRIRRAESDEDAARLRALYDDVFLPERVGELAETFFECLPGMERRYWFLAEERVSGKLVSGFALIPWKWELEGVALDVAEMGLVGTREGHRGRGLMRRLYQEFDGTLQDERFHLSAIQGIPGFYHRFGYHYAVELENHIDVPFHCIPARPPAGLAVRPATTDDIDFLVEQDIPYRRRYALSAVRDHTRWRYLLTDSRRTEYGSGFWIVATGTGRKFYCRVPREGFGAGLIVSEISEEIEPAALMGLLVFLKGEAQRRKKPYIRLNLPNGSDAARMAVSLGATAGRPYAWQIRVPDRVRFLKAVGPLLEARLQASALRGYEGTLRLDLFAERIDLVWRRGRLDSVAAATADDCPNTFCLPGDLFPALCLGYRGWRRMQNVRPDIFPVDQYLRMRPQITPAESGLLIDALFPPTESWIHEQY